MKKQTNGGYDRNNGVFMCAEGGCKYGTVLVVLCLAFFAVLTAIVSIMSCVRTLSIMCNALLV